MTDQYHGSRTGMPYGWLVGLALLLLLAYLFVLIPRMMANEQISEATADKQSYADSASSLKLQLSSTRNLMDEKNETIRIKQQEIAALTSRLSQSSSTVSDLSSAQVAALTEDLASARDEVDLLKLANADLAAQLEDQKIRLEHQQALLASVDSTSGDSNEADATAVDQQVETLNNTITDLQRQVEEKTEELAQQQSLVQSAEQRFEDLAEQTAQYEGQINILNDRLASTSDLETQREELEQQAMDARLKLEQAFAKAAQDSKEIETLTQAMQTASNERESLVEAHQKQIDSLNDQLKAASENIADTNENSGQIEALENAKRTLEEQVTTLSNENEQLIADASALQDKVEDATGQLTTSMASVTEKEGLLATLTEQLEETKAAADALETTNNDLMDKQAALESERTELKAANERLIADAAGLQEQVSENAENLSAAMAAEEEKDTALADLQSKLEQAQAATLALQSANTNLTATQSALERERDELLATVDANQTNEEQAEKVASLESRIEQLQSDRAAIEQQLADESASASQREQTLNEKLKAADEQITSMQTQIEMLTQERAAMDEASASLKADTAEKLATLDTRVNELQSERAALEQQLAQESANNTEREQSTNAQLTAATEQVDALQLQINALGEERANLDQELSDLKASHEQALQAATSKFDVASENLAVVEEQYDALSAQGDELREKLRVTQDEAAAESTGLKEELALLQEQQDTLLARLTESETATDEASKVRQTLESQVLSLNEQIATDKAAYDSRLTQLVADKDALSEQLKSVESKSESLSEELNQRATSLQGEVTTLRDSNAELLKTVDDYKASVQNLEQEVASQSMLVAARDASLKQMFAKYDEDTESLNMQALQSGEELQRMREVVEQPKLAAMSLRARAVISFAQAGMADIQTTVRDDNEVSVNLRSEALFKSGQVQLSENGRETMLRVATALQDFSDKTIRVEGHTDDVPVGGVLQATHASNWEVSVARAASAARFLAAEGGIEPGRLSAQGFGEHQPVAPNETPEGRQLNRRIEIIIKP